MKLELTNNWHEPSPEILYSISDDDALSKSLQFFDKDGYELTPLEQYWHHNQGIDISEKHLYHTAHHKSWFKDAENAVQGPVLDHCIINTRWVYGGDARLQLLRLKEKRPLLNKLLSIKSKYGIDISIDYVSEHVCFELFHIEVDRNNFQEICDIKRKAEDLILSTDWDNKAIEVFNKKEEWKHLASDDQSDWKARFFGWDRAFDNRKVYV